MVSDHIILSDNSSPTYAIDMKLQLWEELLNEVTSYLVCATILVSQT